MWIAQYKQMLSWLVKLKDFDSMAHIYVLKSRRIKGKIVKV